MIRLLEGVIRSYLFVPGDDRQKLQKACRAGADALILDLEDSVAADRKGAARAELLSFLKEARKEAERPALFVRINSLESGLSDSDLDHIMVGAPDGIVLPKAAGRVDLERLDSRISVREALHGLPDGSTATMAIVTETPSALFHMGEYEGVSARLSALTWGAEDLAAAVGATVTRDDRGNWTSPVQIARGLALYAAAAAGAEAVDTVFTDYRDERGLLEECAVSARDGFAGKLAIHPAQVPIINDAFTPSTSALAAAERIVEAFAQQPDAGVLVIDGRMCDRPHLLAARRLLARQRARPGS